VGATILYPSTDYVFDGSSPEPYIESDMPSPVSAYGRSKQAGETSRGGRESAALHRPHLWLFGLGGKNFVETMLRLGRQENEVSWSRPGWPPDLHAPSRQGHRAVDLRRGVRASTTSPGVATCSWYDFAQEIFDQAGLECA